jgi:hypothetical protein
MDSWPTTLRLMIVMAVIAACYLVGRWLAEMLQEITSGGVLPSL